MSYTIAELVTKHNEIKAYLEAEQEAFDTRIKPYKQGLAAILNSCGVLLQEQGQQNAKTEDGTAYLNHGLSVKVDNREKFLEFVTNQNWDFLDAGVLKDPVRAYREQHNADPPGVKCEEFVKCLIRRT
jgi:hypothetical protein